MAAVGGALGMAIGAGRCTTKPAASTIRSPRCRSTCSTARTASSCGVAATSSCLAIRPTRRNAARRCVRRWGGSCPIILPAARRSRVGASLLAMAKDRFAHVLNVPPSSRASSLPQDGCNSFRQPAASLPAYAPALQPPPVASAHWTPPHSPATSPRWAGAPVS